MMKKNEPAMTRRELLVLTGTFALAGCAHSAEETSEPEAVPRARGPVDAGPLRNFAAQGVYDRFRASHGFFVIREGNKLFAQSAVCTHRDCLLSRSSHGFRCRCHGSTFTIEGKVTRGPAHRNLPRFAVERSADAHLIVHPEQRLSPDQFDNPQAFVTISD
jgi:cytochrome b6-f complex iron-sulfur subunit